MSSYLGRCELGRGNPDLGRSARRPDTTIGIEHSGVRSGSGPTAPARRRTAGSGCGSRWVGEEGEVVGVIAAALLGVVADDDARPAEVGREELQRRPHHRVQMSMSTKSIGPSRVFRVS